MGRRKTNIKKKIQNKKNKAAMMRQKYEIGQIVEECFSNIMDVLVDDMFRQEAYRWN